MYHFVRHPDPRIIWGIFFLGVTYIIILISILSLMEARYEIGYLRKEYSRSHIPGFKKALSKRFLLDLKRSGKVVHTSRHLHHYVYDDDRSDLRIILVLESKSMRATGNISIMIGKISSDNHLRAREIIPVIEKIATMIANRTR